MNTTKISAFLLMITLVTMQACSSKKTIIVPEVNELDQLQSMMTGSYDSSAQEAADSSYYNISLHMYPIWENRSDGKYLYVEQALASMQDKPYRQRVYKLVRLDNGNVASYVYTLKQEDLFIGKWNDADYFDRFGLSILDERVGCEVVLQKSEKGYEGSTVDDNCKSTLRGATYATSIVSMEADKITSWDQGFDDQGKQVWGATKGPYVFVKLKN